jgi:hypothetical protein
VALSDRTNYELAKMQAEQVVPGALAKVVSYRAIRREQMRKRVQNARDNLFLKAAGGRLQTAREYASIGAPAGVIRPRPALEANRLRRATGSHDSHSKNHARIPSRPPGISHMEGMMEREFSRRTAIAALAASAAIPSIALAADGSGDDSELIECGRQLDVLYAAHAEANRLSQPYWDAVHAWRDAQGDRHVTNEEWMAAATRLEREVPLPSPNLDEIMNAMDDPMRRIMALPAKTPAGLAVKARLVKHENSELWDEPFEDLDWDKVKLRALIDSVLAFAERRGA